jgi:hypothetical protein
VNWHRTAPVTTQGLAGVWCSGQSEVVAVGAGGTILTGAAHAWRVQPCGTDENLYAVSGAGELVVAVGGNLHIGGNSLIAHRRAGEAWKLEPSGMQHILLCVCPSAHGWVTAGYNGAILRGGPSQWHRESVVHYVHVFAVCALGKRVFAAGLGGSIIEFDGSSWHAHPSPVEHHLRALAPAGSESVIAVGLNGTVLRFDGNTWRSVPSRTTAPLESVWMLGPDHGYAVGYGGTVLRCEQGVWREEHSGTTENLHAVHGTASEVVAVGERGTIITRAT